MNDTGKSAYADAVANTVAGFVDDLAANSRTVFCSPDGKEERTIPVGEEGEAFVGIKVNPDVLMNQIRERQSSSISERRATENGLPSALTSTRKRSVSFSKQRVAMMQRRLPSSEAWRWECFSSFQHLVLALRLPVR